MFLTGCVLTSSGLLIVYNTYHKALLCGLKKTFSSVLFCPILIVAFKKAFRSLKLLRVVS